MYRAETDAVLVSAGVHWQPFSELALAELPQLAAPEDWQVPPHEAAHRLDLRGDNYFICSIDPPGKPLLTPGIMSSTYSDQDRFRSLTARTLSL